jgi:hypothetical protein
MPRIEVVDEAIIEEVLAFCYYEIEKGGDIQYGKHVTKPTFQEP